MKRLSYSTLKEAWTCNLMRLAVALGIKLPSDSVSDAEYRSRLIYGIMRKEKELSREPGPGKRHGRNRPMVRRGPSGHFPDE